MSFDFRFEWKSIKVRVELKSADICRTTEKTASARILAGQRLESHDHGPAELASDDTLCLSCQERAKERTKNICRVWLEDANCPSRKMLSKTEKGLTA